MSGIKIKNLTVQAGSRTIISDLSLDLADNQIYILRGHNGCGKSTLVNAIMGSPDYTVTKGNILLDEQDITDLSTDERAKLGLFIAMQYPVEIAGISYADFLRVSLQSLDKLTDFSVVLKNLQQNAALLGFTNFDYHRDLNVGFSGGEKKKSEILQMLTLRPRFAFLDEPDSGLDQQSVQLLSNCLHNLDYPTSLIIITHNQQLLDNLAVKPANIINLEKINGHQD